LETGSRKVSETCAYVLFHDPVHVEVLDAIRGPWSKILHVRRKPQLS